MTRFEQFIKHRQYLLNVSQNTLRWYRHAFKWLPSESPSQEQLDAVILKMRESGLKPTGCNAAARAINAYLHWSSDPSGKCGGGCHHPRIKPMREADVAFYPLPDPLAVKGTRFVLGGWYRKNGKVELFAAVIFNNLVMNEQRQLVERPTVDTKFLYSLGDFLPVEYPHLVRVDSPGAKEDWVEEQVRILRKVMSNQAGEQAIVRACVDVIRRAAGWTTTISKAVIVATLKKSGKYTTTHLSDNDEEGRLVPDIITPNGATTEATIKAIVAGDEVSGTFNAQVLKR